MAAFDIGSFAKSLQQQSVQVEHRDQIEYIPLDKIDQDPNNFYSLSGIEELADNICLCGLQQPIRVRDGENGHVIVVSGHRRRAAIELLAKEDEKWKQVPCIRETGGSDAMNELRLIYANASTRELTSAEKAKQIERTEALLYQLQQEGMEFPGRMRDHVAEVCQVSGAKIAKLKVIQDRLLSEWWGLFEENKLAEQTAYALARMEQDLQKRIYDVNPSIGGAAAERILKMAENGTTWEPTLRCPDGTPCHRGNQFLKHDIEKYFDPCKGERCCLNCQMAKTEYYSCNRMCSKARDLRKEVREAKEQTQMQQKQEQQRVYQEQIQTSAQRLVRAADHSGVPDDTKIEVDGFGLDMTVGALRRYARGEFGDSRLYDNYLAPDNIDFPREVAAALRCTTDYVLGVSDRLDDKPTWKSPDECPEDRQIVYAKIRIDDAEIEVRDVVTYQFGRWFFRRSQNPVEGTVLGWFPLPMD